MTIILAYVDPGLGALLWQSCIAAFIGFLFYLQKTRRWIVGVFRKMFGRGRKPPGAVAATPASEKTKVESDAP
jgi:hypothetical protein